LEDISRCAVFGTGRKEKGERRKEKGERRKKKGERRKVIS
jgi:hypothetical protein